MEMVGKIDQKLSGVDETLWDALESCYLRLEVVTWDNVHKVNNNVYKTLSIVWHRMGVYLVIITIIIEKNLSRSLESWGICLDCFYGGSVSL